MAMDPFEQFERSRGGMLIPLAVFVIGGTLTVAAVRGLHLVSVREDAAIQATDVKDMTGDANSLTQQNSARRVSETDLKTAPVETLSP